MKEFTLWYIRQNYDKFKDTRPRPSTPNLYLCLIANRYLHHNGNYCAKYEHPPYKK